MPQSVQHIRSSVKDRRSSRLVHECYICSAYTVERKSLSPDQIGTRMLHLFSIYGIA